LKDLWKEEEHVSSSIYTCEVLGNSRRQCRYRAYDFRYKSY